MATAFVNAGRGTLGGSGTSYALPATSLTAGNYIICAIGIGTVGITVSSVTDTAGNTYTKIVSFTGGRWDPIEVWHAKNVLGNASNVVTFNLSGTAANQVGASAQYSGTQPTAGATDHVSSASASSLTSNSFSIPANAIADVVAFGMDASNGTTWTAGTNYTNRIATGSTWCSPEDRLAAPTGSQTSSISVLAANQLDLTTVVLLNSILMGPDTLSGATFTLSGNPIITGIQTLTGQVNVTFMLSGDPSVDIGLRNLSGLLQFFVLPQAEIGGAGPLTDLWGIPVRNYSRFGPLVYRGKTQANAPAVLANSDTKVMTGGPRAGFVLSGSPTTFGLNLMETNVLYGATFTPSGVPVETGLPTSPPADGDTLWQPAGNDTTWFWVMRDGGAIGNGIVSDQTAFQAAANSNKRIFVEKPPVNFKLTSVISIKHDIYGDGHRPYVKLAQVNGEPAYQILRIQDKVDSPTLTVQGLKLDGLFDGVGTVGEQSHGVMIAGSLHVKVRYCTIQNCYGDNVYIGGGAVSNGGSVNPSQDITVEHNTLTNPRRCNVALTDVLRDAGTGVGALVDANTMNKTMTYVASVDCEPNPNGADRDDYVSITNNVQTYPTGRAVLLYHATSGYDGSGNAGTNIVVTGNSGDAAVPFFQQVGNWLNVTQNGNTWT